MMEGEYCVIGELEDLQKLTYKNLVDSSQDVTYYRKLICPPKESFAVGLLILFFEHLLRESTPTKQLVMEFARAYN